MTFKEITEVLETKKVGIAGCGGLGSNCAIALTRVGIGNLVIADYDFVDRSNLNRQYFFLQQIGKKKVDALKENILAINPNCNVECFDIQLQIPDIIKIFKDCDIIVEAFDEAIEKKKIIETVLGEFPGTPIISGVGLAGYGKNNLLKTKNYGDLYICGDTENEVSEDDPPLAPRVGIVANMQANQVMELLLN